VIHRPALRRTKIVATVGPASADEQTLAEMIDAGVNVLRINSSHGTAELRAEWMDRIRVVRDRVAKPVGLLVDLQGPRIRVGALPEPRELVNAQHVVFAPEAEASGDELPTTYEALADDVTPGARILLDDGLLGVEVTEVHGRRVKAVVRQGGVLKSNKGMNLPDVQVSAPALTEKDVEDVQLAAKHCADFIGLSFVRRSADVEIARTAVPKGPQLISKIEIATALDDLDHIVEAADAIMVARGDLGVELPFEEVPLAQKRVIWVANRAGRAVITATQMLESMVEKPRPTRAEASDVANAVLDGTDAVMLSAETAEGAYPVEAVRAMVRIVERTEKAAVTDRATPQKLRQEPGTGPGSVDDAIAVASCAAAHMLKVPMIVCFTKSGFTARKVAAHRPGCPIVGLTTEPATYHQLSLTWGVLPALVDRAPTYETMLDIARDYLTSRKYVQSGDLVVVTAGVPFEVPGTTNLLKVEVV
jgi:pyruvate kinase